MEHYKVNWDKIHSLISKNINDFFPNGTFFYGTDIYDFFEKKRFDSGDHLKVAVQNYLRTVPVTVTKSCVFSSYGDSNLLKTDRDFLLLHKALALLQLRVRIRLNLTTKEFRFGISPYAFTIQRNSFIEERDTILKWLVQEGIVDDGFLLKKIFSADLSAYEDEETKNNMLNWLNDNVVINTYYLDSKKEEIFSEIDKEMEEEMELLLQL